MKWVCDTRTHYQSALHLVSHFCVAKCLQKHILQSYRRESFQTSRHVGPVQERRSSNQAQPVYDNISSSRATFMYVIAPGSVHMMCTWWHSHITTLWSPLRWAEILPELRTGSTCHQHQSAPEHVGPHLNLNPSDCLCCDEAGVFSAPGVFRMWPTSLFTCSRGSVQFWFSSGAALSLSWIVWFFTSLWLSSAGLKWKINVCSFPHFIILYYKCSECFGRVSRNKLL